MTPGARVQAAIDVLDEIRAGTPAERALSGWARRSRFAGSKDRASVRDHVFQALRGMRSYAALGGAETGRGMMIGVLRAAGCDLSEFFSGIGYAPAPLTPSEVEAGQPPRSPEARLDLQNWMIPHFIKALGDEDDVERTADTLRERAPVMLRVNHRKTGLSEAIDILAEDGIEAATVPRIESALSVGNGARRIAGSSAYRQGVVELQDGSSQAAMNMLKVIDGSRVLDYCAGGGGKTLALAARHDARWYAHDALPQRLKDLPERANRAGVSVTILDRQNAHGRAFDLVLCDVPCSGSGTWRRTPDAKWRLSESDLAALNETQEAILAQAAPLVAPGGVLAYATCSLFVCENEERVASFLARHPDWQAGAQNRWPISDKGDGFFLAQLKRK